MPILEYVYPLKLLILKTLHTLQGYEIIYLNKEYPISSNAIYAFNHSCCLDAPVASEVIKRHCYIMVGVQNLKIIDRLFFAMNGVIWVDRHNAKSRNDATGKMCNLLEAGKNIMYFPEGTWNLHPAKPMLPMYWGGIDIARKTKCPIVPVCMEYYGKRVYVKFGNPITVQPEHDKQKKFEELTEAFATLKWEIWEQFPIIKHGSNDVDWNLEVRKRLAAYPKLNYEYEKSIIRKPYTEPEEAFAFLHHLKPRRENAFLFSRENGRYYMSRKSERNEYCDGI